MRFIQVILDYESAFGRTVFYDLFAIPGQVDSLTLGEAVGLHDKRSFSVYHFATFIDELFPEIGGFLRDDPRLREKLIVVGKGSLHLH